LVATVIATVVFIGGLEYVFRYVSVKNEELLIDSVKVLDKEKYEIEYDNRTKKLKLPDTFEVDWVEILKDNKVIFVKGKKQDDKTEYSQGELAQIIEYSQIINNDYDFTDDKVIKYRCIPFKGVDGENYTCLLKKYENKFNFSFKIDVPNSIWETDYKKELFTKLMIVLSLFIVVLIIIILLFGRVTYKKIILPLKELNKGIQNVINGEYTENLDFKGNSEFTQLRDAFNYMIKKLHMAESENKKISESKKRLLLDISHDLRTPITTIQGYTNALCNDMVAEEEKKKKYLSYIYEKSKHVTDLIEMLFKYSKLESSVYDLNMEMDNLCEFLRNVVIGFYGELNNKGFDLDIDIPDEKIFCNFDKIELERAISNIIGNIIKYNPPHTNLFVHLKQDNEDIKIVIGDDGVGISKDIQDKIFNALVRGDRARKTDGGLGLGLAITKKIIELHGGTINLESEEGEGSIFTINLKVEIIRD